MKQQFRFPYFPLMSFSNYKKDLSLVIFFCTVIALKAVAQDGIYPGNYLLQNVSTGQYMTVRDTDNGKLTQQSKIGQNPQRFEVSQTDEGYTIKSIASDTIEAYFTISASALKLASRSSKGQQWKLDNVGTSDRDAFTIQGIADTKLIGVNSTTDIQIVLLAIGREDKRAQWRFVPVLEAGRYKLQNISTGLFMSVVGGSRNNGAKIEQATENNENWQLFDVVELGQGEGYSISPVNTRKTKWLSVNRNVSTTGNPVGTQLFIQSALSFATAGDEQSWEIASSSSFPDKNDQFSIRSLFQSSSKSIGVQNATTPAVTQTNFVNSDSRLQWRFIKVPPFVEIEEGKYQIQNVATGKYMEVNAASTADGAKIVQAQESSAKNQRFKIVYEGDKYRILPTHTYNSKWLSVQPSGNADGTELFIANKSTTNQIWDIKEIENEDPDPNFEEVNFVFSIRSELSGKWIGTTDASDNAKITQQSKFVKTDERFLWRFVYIEPDFSILQEGRYLVQNVKTAKVMDVAASSQADNASVIQYNVSATDNQLFDVYEVGDNQYRISPAHTNSQKWISVYGGTATDRNANGKALIQLSSNPSLQTWEILKTDDEEDESFTVRSTDPSSKKLLGVYSGTDRRIVQWDINDKNDTRFQWRFMTVGEFNDKQTNSVTSPALVIEKANANARKAALLENTNPETGTKPQVVVYPNPVNGDFEVKITQFDAADNLNAQIVDMQGKPVYQNAIGTERRLKLNTQQLQMKSGTYLMEVNNGQQRHTTKIMVIE
jgi:Ricin-type beta-trefoil lectin domain-like/Secretion system C-terminal sorting domain